MNILNIIQGTNLGGMEQASLQLMRGLQEKNFEFQVLSLTPLGELRSFLSHEGIVHEGMEYAGTAGWRSFLSLRKRLRAIDADGLLMTGHNLMAMLAIDEKSYAKRVLAIHFHHQGVMPHWQWRIIYRLAIKKFETIVFPSNFIRDEAVAIWPPVKDVAHVIANPVSLPDEVTAHQRLRACRQLGVDDDAFIIGNAGWLIKRKRFDVFLNVAVKVIALAPQSLFLIAGGGPEEEVLRCQARELGIDDHIRWLGWRKDMTSFYSALDVLLFNSDWDAMGRTVLEAMSHNVPVVASVVNGGLAEVISSPEFGDLIDLHDTGYLAERIVLLSKDECLRQKIGMAGRARISSECSPVNCALSYERLFDT